MAEPMYVKIMRVLLENGLTLSYIASRCGVDGRGVDHSAVRRWKLGVDRPNKANGERLQWLAAQLIAGGPEADKIRAAGRRKKPRKGIKPAPANAFPPERVKALMEKTGWSAIQLARLCGVSRQNIYFWASGKTRPTAAAQKILAELEAHPPARDEVDAAVEVLDIIGPGRLRTLLANLGWNQQELAEHMGIPPKTLQSWLTGARTPTGAAVKAIRNLEATVGLIYPQEER